MKRGIRILFGFLLPSVRHGNQGVEQEDLRFMSEVDAAIHRTGTNFAYLLSMVVFLLVIGFLFWASQAVLDEVTRGAGQVIPSQRVQVIQNLEGGILEQIFVEENQIVNRGDTLVRLSNEIAASQYRDFFQQALAQEAAIARLLAETRRQPLLFPDSLKDHPELRQTERSVFDAKKQQQESEIKVLKAQLGQKQQEVREMRGRLKQLRASMKAIDEQLAIAKGLLDQGLYAKVDYLQLQREKITTQGDIDALRLGIPRVEQAVEEARRRISQREAEFQTLALDELNRRQGELKSLTESIRAGQDRVSRTDVQSPVRGTIKQININTIGGVIKPGEPIMEVVPLDDTLLIEARIRPADIAFLHPGQHAMVKISAYDFSIYGGLEGTVEQISADTITDDDGESYYKVKLRTKTNSLTYRGAKLPIIPGMTANVDILTGQKSVLDYLLKPILKAKQNALRER